MECRPKNYCLLIIAILISFTGYSQKAVYGLGTLPIDTGVVARHFRVDSTIKALKYKTADSNKVLGFDADGNAVLRTKSNGTTFDTTGLLRKRDTSRNGIVVTYWVLDSTNRNNIKYSDTATKVATKWDVDSVKDGVLQQFVKGNYIVPKEGDSALIRGTVGAWDEKIREIGNIVKNDTAYFMTYSGYIPPYAGNNVYVGLAMSYDGYTWYNVGKIITRASEDPFMIKSGNTYYLYYEDKQDVPFRNIRLSTSTDLVNWTDQGDVLDIGTGWEDRDVSSPVVWKVGNNWHMYYEGRGTVSQQGAIGYATSTDGITWTKYGSNPVASGYQSSGNVKWCSHLAPDDIILANDKAYVFIHGWDGREFRPSILVTRNFYQVADYSYSWITDTKQWADAIQPFKTANEYIVAYTDTGANMILGGYMAIRNDFITGRKPIVVDTSIEGKLLIIKNNAGFSTSIRNGATANRTDTMPDKSGTIAMTSDIQTYTNGYGLNLSSNTFSADTSSANGLVTQYDLASATPPTPNLQQVTTAGATTTDGVTLGNLTTDTVYGGTGSGGNLQLTSTSNATKGLIRFGTSAYDEVNNRLGIGITSPAVKMHVTNNTTATTGAGVATFTGANGGNAQVTAEAFSGAGLYTGRRANNTAASPTGVVSGNVITSISSMGYNGSSFNTAGAAINLVAAENFTSSSTNATYIDFQTRSSGGSLLSRARVTELGNFVAKSSPSDDGSGRTIQTTRLGASDSILSNTVLFAPNHIIDTKTFVTTGSNKSAGTATLSAGTVTVNTTAVTANSIIFVTGQGCSSCGSYYISTKTAGTSFVISSTNVLDASTVAWWIIN